MSVYASSLSYDVERQDIDDVFSECGRVARISIPMDREMGWPCGFAFVELSLPAQEQMAIQELNGAESLGRCIEVSEARARSSTPAVVSGGIR